MRQFVFALLLMFSIGICAQPSSSIETRALAQAIRSSKGGHIDARLLKRYPIRNYHGVKSIGVIAKVNAQFDAELWEQKGIKITSRVADIVSMRVPLNSLGLLSEARDIEQYSVTHRVAPTSDGTRFDTHADSVQAGVGTAQPFDGSGVLIGITDWGFDYRHPNINSRRNQRIVRAWDHYKLSGPAPDGFDYGTEYSTIDELFDALGDTSGLYGYGSHGTHVAGIAGGSGTDGKHIGVAPQARYLLGSWLLDEGSWLDQVAWMYKVAKQEQQRLVINSSWGMYTFSNIDGTSLLSQAINHYSDSGVVFVTSGGNNGNNNFHIAHTFNHDTMKTIPTWYSTGIGEALIMWGTPDHQFMAQVAMRSNSTDTMLYSPWFSTADNLDYEEHYWIVNGDTVRYDVMTERSNANDRRPHIIINIDRADYVAHLFSTSDSGSTVHYWNVCNVENHAGNGGSSFSNGGYGSYSSGDNAYGIGEPACAAKAITVAAHTHDYTTLNGQFHEGGIAAFSSHGPALGEGLKPELSAPGVDVISSISSLDGSNRETVATAISGGKPYKWARMSGTSMSSPAVSGIVALMLQANPNLSTDQVREILFATTRNDGITGPLHESDSTSPIWGHGKVDALAAVNAAYDKLAIDNNHPLPHPVAAYPNPAHNSVTIASGSNYPTRLTIYNMSGQAVLTTTFTSTITIDISTLSPGPYAVSVTGTKTTGCTKLVVK